VRVGIVVQEFFEGWRPVRELKYCAVYFIFRFVAENVVIIENKRLESDNVKIHPSLFSLPNQCISEKVGVQCRASGFFVPYNFVCW